LLLCREDRAPGPELQLPALEQPLVPLPEIDQVPGAHVEIERYPDVPTGSQIPLAVTALEDEQPPLDPLSLPTTTPVLLPYSPSRIRTVSVSR
jgi:hypothetical protein